MKLPQELKWLMNPSISLSFLIGIPTIFILFLIVYHSSWFPLIKYGSVFEGFLSYLTVSHFFATILIVYLLRGKINARPVIYLWVPLLLCLLYSTSTLLKIGRFNSSVIFYWIVCHEIFQYYFILRFYNSSKIGYSKIDWLINTSALILGPVYFSAWSFSFVNIPVYGKVFMLHLSWFWMVVLRILTIISLCVFFIRQVYMYLRRKTISVFTILMVVTINLIFYLPLLFFKDGMLFITTSFRFNHSIQYILWVIIYIHIMLKDRVMQAGGLIGKFILSDKKLILFTTLILIAFLYLRTSEFWEGMLRNRIPLVYGLGYYNLAIVHLYYDSILWWNSRKIGRLILVS